MDGEGSASLGKPAPDRLGLQAVGDEEPDRRHEVRRFDLPEGARH